MWTQNAKMFSPTKTKILYQFLVSIHRTVEGKMDLCPSQHSPRVSIIKLILEPSQSLSPHSEVTAAMVIADSDRVDSFGGDADEVFSLREAEIVVLSAGYRAGTHPGYDPR